MLEVEKIIKINVSDRKEVRHHIVSKFNICSGAAQLLVVEALEKERVVFAIQYIKGSGKGLKEIFDDLCKIFATPGQTIYKDMVDRVLSKALCKIGLIII